MTFEEKLRAVDAARAKENPDFFGAMCDFAAYLNKKADYLSSETDVYRVTSESQVIRLFRVPSNRPAVELLCFDHNGRSIWASPPNQTLRGPVTTREAFEKILLDWYNNSEFRKKLTE